MNQVGRGSGGVERERATRECDGSQQTVGFWVWNLPVPFLLFFPTTRRIVGTFAIHANACSQKIVFS
jgi:hypothetical protein